MDDSVTVKTVGFDVKFHCHMKAMIIDIEQAEFEADGYYCVGNGIEEKFVEAKEKAHQDARRAASEKVSAYLEMLNANLTNDEIHTIASNFLKVLDEYVPVETTSESVVKFRCHIKAVISSEHSRLVTEL